MEVKILKNDDPTDLEMQIDSYHSTGWRMEGDIVAVALRPEVMEQGHVDRVLYVQKMVRGEA